MQKAPGHDPVRSDRRSIQVRKRQFNVMKTTETVSISARSSRRASRSCWLAIAVGALLLAACGGGGSTSTDASASGLSVGTVTGFGSIIVDGVHYDDRNVVAGIDTPPTAPDAPASGASVDVKLGQHVEVTFTGAESNSVATSISVSAELVGKVSAIAPNLVVAGQIVMVNSDAAA